MEKIYPYTQRELSWLSFNYRVLQEAKDPNVPLLERIKFLAIYSSNLDEFFKVRVAWVRNLMLLSKKTKKQFNLDPALLLASIKKKLKKQLAELNEILHQSIIPELQKKNIYIINEKELNLEQLTFVQKFFEEELLTYIQPILLVKQKIRPFLKSAALYLAISLKGKSKGRNIIKYAIVKIPSEYAGRFVQVPSAPNTHTIMFLDDIVRCNLTKLFPGYIVENAYSIKLTRDADLHLDEDIDKEINLVEKLQNSLAKRNIGQATRFVYDTAMPPKLLNTLKEVFSVHKLDLFPEGTYHNNFDFFKFPNLGEESLCYRTLQPVKVKEFIGETKLLDIIKKKDVLLHFPYQSYQYVLQFFQQAAEDLSVKEIYITLYRVAKKSKIIEALQKAVKNGKKVTAFVELKARFDEEANLQWANKLEEIGVSVLYSIPNIKVHTKLALVVRKEGRLLKKYAYLSTGNFNEDSATIYGDLSLFTADKRLTNEVETVFRYLIEKEKEKISLQHLLVGQINLYEQIHFLINEEIQNAKEGKKAAITFKVNNLEEKSIIQKLYQASQAGVKIRLIVRSTCCLVPQVPYISENIEVISIIDRFLEHSRIYIFHNNGNEKIYLSSADLMTRNLLHRVECAFPIYDKIFCEEINYFIETQWADNQKARIINVKQNNPYQTKHRKQKLIRSQMEMYKFYEEKINKF